MTRLARSVNLSNTYIPLRVYVYLYLTAIHINRSTPPIIFFPPLFFHIPQVTALYAGSERLFCLSTPLPHVSSLLTVGRR